MSLFHQHPHQIRSDHEGKSKRVLFYLPDLEDETTTAFILSVSTMITMIVSFGFGINPRLMKHVDGGGGERRGKDQTIEEGLDLWR